MTITTFLADLATEHGGWRGLARALGLSEKAVYGWTDRAESWKKGQCKPSARSCKRLALLSGESEARVRELAGLGEGRCHGRVELPVPEEAVEPSLDIPAVLPTTACYPVANHPGCRDMDGALARMGIPGTPPETCQILLRLNLPALCESWEREDVERVAYLLKNGASSEPGAVGDVLRGLYNAVGEEKIGL